ncbi:MAG: N-acetylmuramic acid 6-phosphate etherase [Alphaproteobacteria bacterium]
MRTEGFASRYRGLDAWDNIEILETILEAQFLGLAAIKPVVPAMSAAAGAIADRLRGPAGRLAYAGAGTSARLAVIDGTELTPTFGWPPERTCFLIAGGLAALTRSIEGAEDDEAAGAAACASEGLGPDDVLIAVAASGRTPYTLGACRTARAAGALTIGLAHNPGSALLEAAEHPLLVDTGPEAISGSTRLKAGTAQKAVLNMLSTLVMVRLGKVYDGLMVDVTPTNDKLRERARRMVSEIAQVDEDAATTALDAAAGSVKLAALLALGLPADTARTLLEESGGHLRQALQSIKN